MIQKYVRELNKKELQILRGEIKQAEKSIKKMNIFCLIASAIVLSIGIPYAVSSSKKELVYLCWGVMAVYLIIVLWIKVEQNIGSKKRIKNIIAAITNNTAEVLHCQSQQMIELEEVEDEGPCYLFQVDDNKILSLGGQEVYEDKTFKNTDFEIVISHGKDPLPVLFEKYTYGEKLKPIKIISGREKWKLMENKKFHLRDLEVFEGRLEDF